jgi:NADH dehydrogenase (ubiquinone) 1 alpha subcomplex subunit 5
MRRTLRLLAGVKPVRYLEAGNPTGITGLFTHPSPRSTLLFLYSSTLDKIKAIPEHSLYRQSVEAVTKHRLELVESVTPPGYEEWATKARERISKHPEQFRIFADGALDGSRATRIERDGKQFVIRDLPRIKDERYQEWDGEKNEGPELEGSRSGDERKEQEMIAKRAPLEESEKVHWDPEPQLTIDQ